MMESFVKIFNGFWTAAYFRRTFILEVWQGSEYTSKELSVSFTLTAQKMKFSTKDSFSKCDQIRRKPQIWSHNCRFGLIYWENP